MSKVIYWRNEVPPMHEQIEGEHVVEARSKAVHRSFGDHDDLWGQCYPDLMKTAAQRITDEVTRLGGSCAHVIDEAVNSKVNEGTSEFWLHGRFTFLMYVHRGAPR
jgi:hypothetical protein